MDDYFPGEKMVKIVMVGMGKKAGLQKVLEDQVFRIC